MALFSLKAQQQFPKPTQDNVWYFACEGDTHFRVDYPAPGQPQLSWLRGDFIQRYTKLKALTTLDFTVVVGDCTEKGSDGWYYWVLPKFADDEVGAFTDKFVGGVERLGIPVYVGPGNHDVANKWMYPRLKLLTYIRDRYNATYSFCDPYKAGCYNFRHRDLHFISMGIYPKNLGYLQSTLQTLSKAQPLVIYFHYSFDPGSLDWWTVNEQEAFYNVIKEYNVKLIINGHKHSTALFKWKNFPVLIVFDTAVVQVADNGDFIAVDKTPLA